MKLLDQFAEEVLRRGYVRFDPHHHCVPGRNGSLVKILERAFGRLDMVNVVDFVNQRADGVSDDEQKFVRLTDESHVADARSRGYEVEVGDFYVFARDPLAERVLAIGGSKEIRSGKKEKTQTYRGQGADVLVVGVRRGNVALPADSFGDVVDQYNDGELFVGSNVSSQAEVIEHNGNGWFLPIALQNRCNRRAVREYEAVLVEGSDQHRTKFKGSYNKIPVKYLAFHDERALRASVHQSIVEGNFEGVHRPNSLFDVMHHMAYVPLWNIAQKVRRLVGSKTEA